MGTFTAVAELAHLSGHRTVSLAACHARITAVLTDGVASYTGHEHTLGTVARDRHVADRLLGVVGPVLTAQDPEIAALQAQLDRVLDCGVFPPDHVDVLLVDEVACHDSDEQRQDAVTGLLDTWARRIPPGEEHR